MANEVAAACAVTPPTILGRDRPRIPVAGRIRAGIKVLTRKAEQNERAQYLYDLGLAQGRGFEEIERAILRDCPELKNSLVPKNVPYFTVRPGDFPNPEIARTIMDLYAEDRGEGRRLYRFPVVFPADDWQSVMPHELVAWTSSERQFWSEYSADGQTRYCKTYEPVPVNSASKRAIRVFGGRKTVLRKENDGLCDPEKCPQYQNRTCNLSGRFIFFIPGVRSLAAFDLPTNSFYAMQAAIEKFQTIGFMRGGRISGFLDGNGATFYLTKRLVEVSRIDPETGKAVRSRQWLIELEAGVDVTALLRYDEDAATVDVRAANAALVFSEPQPTEVSGAPDRSAVPRDATNGTTQERADAREAAGAPASQETLAGHTPTSSKPTEGPHPVDRDGATTPAQRSNSSTYTGAQGSGEGSGEDSGLAWIFEAAETMGVSRERFEAYGKKKWGAGWKTAQGGRKRALAEIERFSDDAAGFAARVNAEVEVFA